MSADKTERIQAECYADVIIDIAHEKVDRPFQYRVPASLAGRIAAGTPVLVPFGRGDTLRKGYCIRVGDKAALDRDKIKEIAGVADGAPGVDETLIRLAAEIRARYGGTMIQALHTVLPVQKKVGTQVRKYVTLRLDEREASAFHAACVRKKHVARARLIEALIEQGTLPLSVITAKLQVSSSVVGALSDKGIVSISAEHTLRDPAAAMTSGMEAEKRKEIVLSSAQQEVVTHIIRDYDASRYTPCLIHGVTGSGKTEVYIRLIEEMIARGRQAIVLIPEIALTWQTLRRFYRHFADRVSVMNSTLSAGEKSDQFQRARAGEIDVMIGPRSALFTPFERLGVIIIDEEHEPTYKSEHTPRYHAREVAIMRAKLTDGGCTVVLGSATPSLEAYKKASEGTYGLFRLTERLTGGTLAQSTVVDMRRELREGNRSAFSVLLQEKMEERLARGEQTMLFLNRRGVAGFVSCRSCGFVYRCPHCDVTLTAHEGGRLLCHYCGYGTVQGKVCPSCSSPYISQFKAGTQQIEKEVHRLFPRARVLRMDADTTRQRHRYEEILSSFANLEADILVGTQMIVKGHDFPEVTLVGVVAADLGLNVNDFHAAERTFQLLAQAAGRAGRGEKKGDVIIQTYRPEHYAIRAGAAQDYEAFFEEEAGYRALTMYPPEAHMLQVQFFSPDQEAAASYAARLRKRAEEADREIVAVGPAPAQIGRVDDVYRFVLYVKHGQEERLMRLRDLLEEADRDERVQVQYDMDPVRGF